MKTVLIIFFGSILSFVGLAQGYNKLDSLWSEFNKAQSDTLKMQILNEEIGYFYESINTDSAIIIYNQSIAIADKNIVKKTKDTSKFQKLKAVAIAYIGIIEYSMGNYDKAMEYYNNALEINKSINNKTGIAYIYNCIGGIEHTQGEYFNAIDYFTRSAEISESIGDKQKLSSCYNNIGYMFNEMGNYDKALEFYLKSLKIKEDANDKKGLADTYNNIGIVHDFQGNFDKAIEYYLLALKISEETNNKNGMSTSYNNLGIIYKNQHKLDKAIEYFQKALKISEEIGDSKGISLCYINIGNLYFKQGLYDKTMEYYIDALEIAQDLGLKESIAQIYSNIASLKTELADSAALTENQRIKYLNEAIEYGTKSIEMAKEINALRIINEAANILMNAYKNIESYKKAIEYYDIFIITKDSMFNKDKTELLAEMETKYETEKKQLEVEKMQKQKELDNKTIEAQQAKNRKQQIIIFSAIVGFIIVLVFSFIILRMFRQKQKANIMLSEQKAEIEEKNRDILDSITYAKRIQTAILPPQKIVKQYLKESFILYKPKDIVAGDFYWMEHKDNKILFAVADCTGHGVPGAMVSVVCNNGLNRSVREHGLTDPGQILDKTREIVIQEFEKSEEEVTDGMDIAICSLEGNILHYAGAQNPLWIIRNGELLEIKANKQPIGKYRITDPFTTHKIQLEKDDRIYIFSDGYVDQFGGDNSKKFKSKSFKELLLGIQDKSMEEQRIIINQNFESWKGHLEQIDDICIIGVKYL